MNTEAPEGARPPERLEDLAAAATLPAVAVVPTTEDAAGLWDLWVTQGGGEGIVLKEPGSLYHPGQRSPSWLKLKTRLTLEVVVTGGSGELVPRGEGFDLRPGARAEIVCSGVMPSGMLRHPLFVRWLPH